MIMASSPLRVSFIGGGTDFPEWFNENGGAVISTSIDQHVNVLINSLAPIWGTKYKFTYSDVEKVNSVDEIQHPLLKCCIAEFCHPNDRLSLIYSSDLPGNSGLGSSSAFCASVIAGLKLYYGSGDYSPDLIAREAIRIERELLKEAGGWQDQISCSYGGFNAIKFKGNNFAVEPLNYDFIATYLKSCFLIHVGTLRKAHETAVHQKASIKSKTQVYHDMMDLVAPAIDAVAGNKFIDFENIIDESWNIKREYTSEVSNKSIDDAVAVIRSIGGRGIKLLGAGAGGFLLCRLSIKNPLERLRSLGFDYIISVRPTTYGVSAQKFL